MTRAARHDVLVMSDSDIRVTPGVPRRHRRGVRGSTGSASRRARTARCRARVSGRRLEAIGMNTEFLSGVLVARMLEGMKFALGPTTDRPAQGARTDRRMGLPEGFSGRGFRHRQSRRGDGLRRNSLVVRDRAPHRLAAVCARTSRTGCAGIAARGVRGRPDTSASCSRIRCRWRCCWRRCVRSGGRCWLSTARAALRGRVCHGSAGAARSADCLRQWWLIPVQDVLSFAFWMAGFFGNTIAWRGRRYLLRRDGRFELIT